MMLADNDMIQYGAIKQMCVDEYLILLKEKTKKKPDGAG